MTLTEIVAETRKWSAEQRVELVDRLNLELAHDADPAIEAAWTDVAVRRLAGIESGREKPIPGDEVMARARQILRR